MAHLTRDLDHDEGIPYFLWSEETTVEELRSILSSNDNPERVIYVARLLRDGKISDVWKFLTPQEVADAFDDVSLHLGRKKAFWAFLLSVWRKHGVIQ